MGNGKKKDDQTYPGGWAGQGTPLAGTVNAVGTVLSGGGGGSNPSYPEGWAGQGTPVAGAVNTVGTIARGGGGGSNPSYPEGWAGQGTPVAGVVNAIGSVFGGGGGGGAGPSGRMQAMASPASSIINRSIQQSLDNRANTRRTGQTGMTTPTSRTGTIQTGAQRQRAAEAARAARPISADRQRRVDIQATHQTSAQKAADPLNWAGIARDLGNAGDARFRQYRTGQPASTNARRLVGTQQAAARAEVNRGRAAQSASRATNAAKPKKKGGGKNAPKAV